MAKSKSINNDDEEEYIEQHDSTTDQEDSSSDDSDSDSDSSYDILEDTCKSLSKLSLQKSKSKSRVSKVKDCDRKRKLDFDDAVKTPEFDEKDAKSFKTVEEIIKGGQLEKLKVDHCKVYLRKYGLRLTGTKNILLGRIREHLGIMNGGGEHKYPASSFVLNCKGDACSGDVVMFEQNVYEMYNIASRSATGPPCGTRIVAGRIVKESYGAAKQQHTFTIEVLWSKGVKPLPPLHPLLIKGRNLYRLKTVRQKWTDEAERSKVLLEKHSRGFLARSTRETRMQGKENRKMQKDQRARNSTTTILKENQHPNYMRLQNVPNQSVKQPVESAVQSNRVLHQGPQHPLSNQVQHNYPEKQNLPIQRSQKPIDSAFQPNGVQQQNVPMQRLQRPIESALQPNNNLTRHIQPQPPQIQIQFQQNNSMPQQTFRSENPVQIQKSNASRNWWENVAASDKKNSRPQSPLRNPMQQKLCNYFAQGSCKFGDTCKYLHESGKGQSLNAAPRSLLQRSHGQNGFVNGQVLTGMCSSPRHVHPPNGFVNRQALTGMFSPPGNAMRQPCSFFPQGRCYYGDRCKYLHIQRR